MQIITAVRSGWSFLIVFCLLNGIWERDPAHSKKKVGGGGGGGGGYPLDATLPGHMGLQCHVVSYIDYCSAGSWGRSKE